MRVKLPLAATWKIRKVGDTLFRVIVALFPLIVRLPVISGKPFGPSTVVLFTALSVYVQLGLKVMVLA